ncbi:MAG: hypothetical protein KF744_01810 [Taibaiella sp.]|nr:hypothetical protein [Taibaiella sp.]
MILLGTLSELRVRNETLFLFGLVCILAGFLFLLASRLSGITLDGVSAWHKPFKFALSIGIYSWTMAWFCAYLPAFNVRAFSIFTVAALGFEIVYIALQAARGQRSHFNTGTPLYAALYSLMAIAATAVTVYTAYIGFLFFDSTISGLPHHYLLAIRWGIFIFVIFSFEGFVMGGRMSHTIGGDDGNHGIPILNWSRKFGDPRVAHFVGMHALQLLPFLAYYVVKNSTAIHIIAILYLLLALFTLVQALNGRPFFLIR